MKIAFIIIMSILLFCMFAAIKAFLVDKADKLSAVFTYMFMSYIVIFLLVIYAIVRW